MLFHFPLHVWASQLGPIQWGVSHSAIMFGLVIFINVWLEANLQWQEGSIKLRLSTF